MVFCFFLFCFVFVEENLDSMHGFKKIYEFFLFHTRNTYLFERHSEREGIPSVGSQTPHLATTARIGLDQIKARNQELYQVLPHEWYLDSLLQ